MARFMIIQTHVLYCVSSAAAKRVISWSSLDWNEGRFNQLDLVLGTLFDVLAHVATACFLLPHVGSNTGVAASVAVVCVLSAIVLLNPSKLIFCP